MAVLVISADRSHGTVRKEKNNEYGGDNYIFIVVY